VNHRVSPTLPASPDLACERASPPGPGPYDLSVHQNVPIIECDARQRRSTKMALIALVQHAMATPLTMR
jgi:hypothetical protein